jgi:hypothetical protein
MLLKQSICLLAQIRLSNLRNIIPIHVGDEQIKRVETAKHLGVHLDQNLKWDEHIENLSSKLLHKWFKMILYL